MIHYFVPLFLFLIFTFFVNSFENEILGIKLNMNGKHFLLMIFIFSRTFMSYAKLYGNHENIYKVSHLSLYLFS